MKPKGVVEIVRGSEISNINLSTYDCVVPVQNRASRAHITTGNKHFRFDQERCQRHSFQVISLKRQVVVGGEKNLFPRCVLFTSLRVGATLELNVIIQLLSHIKNL